MSTPFLGLVGFALTLALIALGLPVSIAMAVVGLGGIALSGGWDQAAYVLSTARSRRSSPIPSASFRCSC